MLLLLCSVGVLNGRVLIRLHRNRDLYLVNGGGDRNGILRCAIEEGGGFDMREHFDGVMRGLRGAGLTGRVITFGEFWYAMVGVV